MLVKNIEDFYEKLKLEHEDFKKDTHSFRHAVNFVLTANHFVEWLWKGRKSNIKNYLSSKERKSQISHYRDFCRYVNEQCPNMKIIKELANNSKHFYVKTDKVKQVSQTKNWEVTDTKWENMNYNWDYDGMTIVLNNKQTVSMLDVFEEVYGWISEFYRQIK